MSGEAAVDLTCALVHTRPSCRGVACFYEHPGHDHQQADTSLPPIRDWTDDGHVRRRRPDDVARTQSRIRASPATDGLGEEPRRADIRPVHDASTGVGAAVSELARKGQDVSDDVAESVARRAHEVARGAQAVERFAMSTTGDRR